MYDEDQLLLTLVQCTIHKEISKKSEEREEGCILPLVRWNKVKNSQIGKHKVWKKDLIHQNY